MKGSYVGKYGRKRRRGGETKEAPRREVGHTECWHRAHGGGPTLTLASRLGRESPPASLPVQLPPPTFRDVHEKYPSVVLAHAAAHDVGGRERGIIATALCNAVHSSRPREGDVGRALTEFPEPWKRCYGRKI